jgi:hypothetical protein
VIQVPAHASEATQVPRSIAPVTRREVPVRERPEGGVQEDQVTLVSKQPPRKANAATLQSPVVPQEFEAALAAREPPKIEEVQFNDTTTVDPPRIIHRETSATIPLSSRSPMAGISPAAQSVGQPHMPVEAQTVAPIPPPQPQAPPQMAPPQAYYIAPQAQTSITTVTSGVRSKGMPTWVWVIIVLVGGFAIGGGLAFVLATKG